MSTRVLVVDDSLTMRALIARALDRIPGVRVVGTADGAADARAQRDALNPDVMTLDVVMPGMNGIDYLAELMEQAPMPVIMFSARTAAGAAESIEALRLGAVDCFPKPSAGTQNEFDLFLGRLARSIRTARAAAVWRCGRETAPPPVDFVPNGRLLAVAAATADTQRLFDLVAALPANCPPTLVVSGIRADLVASLVAGLDAAGAPRVLAAEPGAPLVPGEIRVAGAGTSVVLDRWPEGVLHLDAPASGREAGPAARLAAVLATPGAAREAAALLLSGGAEQQDIVAELIAAGAHVLAPAADGPRGGYRLAKGLAEQPVAPRALAATLLKLCGR